MCHWHEETKKALGNQRCWLRHLGRQGEMKGDSSSVVGSAHNRPPCKRGEPVPAGAEHTNTVTERAIEALGLDYKLVFPLTMLDMVGGRRSGQLRRCRRMKH